MKTTPSLHQVQVDFNDIYDDDYVLTTSDNIVSSYEVNENDLVELREGHTISCWARVVSASEHLLRCKIDWSTWRSVEFIQDPVSASLERGLADVEAGRVKRMDWLIEEGSQ